MLLELLALHAQAGCFLACLPQVVAQPVDEVVRLLKAALEGG